LKRRLTSFRESPARPDQSLKWGLKTPLRPLQWDRDLWLGKDLPVPEEMNVQPRSGTVGGSINKKFPFPASTKLKLRFMATKAHFLRSSFSLLLLCFWITFFFH
jgi:hypothetical protein